jgi:hypothetical protein
MTRKSRSYLSLLLDRYVCVFLSLLVITVSVADCIFYHSYRKHQVRYDLIEKLNYYGAIDDYRSAFLVNEFRSMEYPRVR